MDKHPSHVEPLIRRWLGLRDHYSNAWPRQMQKRVTLPDE
jgi:hypothetical protein